MIIYKINIPTEQDADAFASFMRNEYFPAIHKGPTRIGQITNLVLLQGENENTPGFFLHLDWSGLAEEDVNLMIRIDDDNVNQKFGSFDARLERIGTYVEVATLT